MIKYSSEIIKHSTKNLININSCGEVKASCGSHIIRPKGRKDYQLIYVADGILEVKRNGSVYTAEKGEVVIFKPDEVQDYRFANKEKNRTFYIHFTGDFCKEYFDILKLQEVFIANVASNRDIYQMFYLAVKYFNLGVENRLFLCSGLTKAILSLISAELSKGNRTDSNNINTSRINELITKFKLMPNLKMTVSDCAEYCNMSESHFRRIFKRITGKAPVDFFTDIKIERAKELLLFTDYNIGEIAENCGFPDQNYFARIFKKQTGKTSLEFRKNTDF